MSTSQQKPGSFINPHIVIGGLLVNAEEAIFSVITCTSLAQGARIFSDKESRLLYLTSEVQEEDICYCDKEFISLRKPRGLFFACFSIPNLL